MLTVPEPAVARVLVDVREHLTDPLCGHQPETAQPGGVDDDPATVEGEQLAGAGGVPSATVFGADGSRGLPVLADQGVGESGLPRTGRPKQHGGPAGGEEGGQLVDPSTGLGAGGHEVGADQPEASSRARTSSPRSVLVSTTTGRAPLSQARVSSRSVRAALGRSAGTVTRTRSTFVASTWALPLSGSWRSRLDQRARTASNRSEVATTQSPTATGTATGRRRSTPVRSTMAHAERSTRNDPGRDACGTRGMVMVESGDAVGPAVGGQCVGQRRSVHLLRRAPWEIAHLKASQLPKGRRERCGRDGPPVGGTIHRGHPPFSRQGSTQ